MDVSPDILAKVRRLTIRSRRLVAEHMAGEFRSAYRGSGIEFDEVREYFPGDDVRTIDWNVTARLGRPFIKRFVEERERVIIIATDLSRSMTFGTGGNRKRDAAAEVAALLGLSALFSHDRVGLFLFTDHLERVIVPRAGNRHVLRLVRDVLGYTPQGEGTDLAGVLTAIERIQRQPAIVFLISDFELPQMPSEREHLERTLRRLGRRHDVTGLWVTDPRERSLEPSGVVKVRNPESGTMQLIDTDHEEVRLAYAREFDTWKRDVFALFSSCRVEGVEIGTERPAWEPLTAFFRKRNRKRVRRAYP